MEKFKSIFPCCELILAEAWWGLKIEGANNRIEINITWRPGADTRSAGFITRHKSCNDPHLPIETKTKSLTFSYTTFSSAFSCMRMSKFSLKFQRFIPRGLTDNKSALVQIMAWHRTGNKPLSEPTSIKYKTYNKVYSL